MSARDPSPFSRAIEADDAPRCRCCGRYLGICSCVSSMEHDCPECGGCKLHGCQRWCPTLNQPAPPWTDADLARVLELLGVKEEEL